MSFHVDDFNYRSSQERKYFELISILLQTTSTLITMVTGEGNSPWWRHHPARQPARVKVIDAKQIWRHWRHLRRTRVKLLPTQQNYYAMLSVSKLFKFPVNGKEVRIRQVYSLCYAMPENRKPVWNSKWRVIVIVLPNLDRNTSVVF